jgi:ankyrin repeat protein
VSISDRENQRQAFIHAAGEGNCKVMSALLDQGVDIKDAGVLAMERAIAADQPNAVEFLIRLDVPVDSTFLLQAATSRCINMVRVLVTHKAKEIALAELTLVFRIVIANGDVELLQTFLVAGVARDPVAVVRALKAATPFSALHLIKAGFDVHGAYLLEERTSLHWAVVHGFPNVVRAILEMDVDIDPMDVWGNTPLHLAAWRGHSNIAKILLERHANENCLNQDGRTPLRLAALMGNSDVIRMLKHSTDQIHIEDNLGKSPSNYAEAYARKRNEAAAVALLSTSDDSLILRFFEVTTHNPQRSETNQESYDPSRKDSGTISMYTTANMEFMDSNFVETLVDTNNPLVLPNLDMIPDVWITEDGCTPCNVGKQRIDWGETIWHNFTKSS